jgi:hypothetical protein
MNLKEAKEQLYDKKKYKEFMDAVKPLPGGTEFATELAESDKELTTWIFFELIEMVIDVKDNPELFDAATKGMPADVKVFLKHMSDKVAAGLEKLNNEAEERNMFPEELLGLLQSPQSNAEH